MNSALRALNRFGLGARPGDARRIGSEARAWLRAQLQGASPARTEPEGATHADLIAALNAREELRQQPREVRRAMQDMQRAARRRLLDIANREAASVMHAQAASERPFAERLVAFWTNHFCIAIGSSPPVAALAGSYERDAIRPHVLGRFRDMVLASARHPAMLLYLDNHRSVGPNSRAARRRSRRLGLNENYARELLELHTLGVDGGYTQADVIALARILTGWTVDGLNEVSASGPVFRFSPVTHEPGPKTLLGATYGEAGVAEGERAIADLCRHPSTATFVATKLVRHFVADEPPAAAVERIARVFRDTGGDLRQVSLALIELPEAWDERHRKFRTPQDWIVAVLRAGGIADQRAVAPLRQLRHPVWNPNSPKGFGDTVREWADPDSLMNRAELARTLARRALRAANAAELAGCTGAPGAESLIPIARDTTVPNADRVALVLASPAFQWRD